MLSAPRSNSQTSNIQWRLFISMFFIVFCMATTYLAFRGNMFNAAPYYVWFSTTGPYSVIALKPNPQPDKDLITGPSKQVFKAGEWLGWKNDVTIEKGVATRISIILVNSVNKQSLRLEENRNPGTEKRTGVKDFFFHIPDNLPPGHYELDRKVVFYPPNNTPVGEDFSPIPFEVAK